MSYVAPVPPAPTTVDVPRFRSARRTQVATLSTATAVTVIEIAVAVLCVIGRDAGPGEALRIADLLMLTARLETVALVAAWVAGCLWLQRARANSDLFPGAEHGRSPAWVWLGWFVPIVSLGFPCQVVGDVHARTDRRSGRSHIVGWWWAAWLTWRLFTRIGTAVISGRDGSALVPVVTTSAALAVVAFVLWCRVVNRVTREQELAWAER